MVGLYEYLTQKNDIKIAALLKHWENKALHSIPKEADKYLTEAGPVDDVNDNHPTAAINKAKKLQDKYKRHYKKMMEKWNNKPIHGKVPSYLDKEYIDIDQSF